MNKNKEELRNELIEEIRNMTPCKNDTKERLIDIIEFIKITEPFNEDVERYKCMHMAYINIRDSSGSYIDYGFVSYDKDKDIISPHATQLSKEEMIEKIKQLKDTEKEVYMIKVKYYSVKYF